MFLRMLPSLLYLVTAWTFSVVPLNAQSPINPDHAVVLGYDRFFAKAKDEGVRGGQLLLAELNCIACHKTDVGLDSWLIKKQAPVLDGVGSRVRSSYLQAFLKDPQATKPGTTMPNLLASLPEQERDAGLDALVHFLASTGNITNTRPATKSIVKGKKLYHQIGCAACHGPRDSQLKDEATVMPLGELAKKYFIPGLTGFLQEPHKTRPSGRMPSLNLKKEEAQDIANYLLANLAVTKGGANMNYSYYELETEPANLPDFTKIKPTLTGKSVGFDLGLAARSDNVAMKFDGFLRTDQEGKYTFHVTSDDGSKLWINGQLVVDNDGIHGPTTKSGTLRLPKGLTPITVGVFNAGSGYELEITMEGPGLAPQPLSSFVSLGAEIAQQKAAPPSASFTVDLAKATKGRELFAGLGCASCHSLKDSKGTIASPAKAPDLSKLKIAGGCLASDTTGKSPTPRYALNASQRAALTAALKDLANGNKAPTAKESIAHAFTTFNCYACHQRDGMGGVEPGVNEFFQTTQKEMGDEGRLPPHLNGVGGKLKADYLKKVLAQGAQDRPYMLTRMPKFGETNLGHLQAALEVADPVPAAPMPTFKVDDKKIKSEGRFMVGNKAFGCIKCHNFREHVSGGVQGMNMTIMANRLRREWFTQYLLDPNKYRPGTRMPAVWPLGQSQLPKVLDGDTAQQVEAVWRYLADGPKAAPPYGVGKEPIPIVALDTALMYRNFIEGAGPRAIGVGYPEKINLAFDANDLRYAMLWHKEFIDASRHWIDRGSGFQPPMGEGIFHLPAGPSIALLPGKEDPWPTKALKAKGYKFGGYRFDNKLRPTFLYNLDSAHVEDFMLPVPGKDGDHFQRTLTITAEQVPDNLWFRAASAADIKDLGNGWYAVGNDLKVRLETPTPPVLRTSVGKTELLLPIRAKQTKIVQELVW